MVESSEKLTPSLEKQLNQNCILIRTPNVKLGYARKTGISKTITNPFLIIDDDIEYDQTFAPLLLKAFKETPQAIAISPKLVHGNRSEIQKIFLTRECSGESGGCCIMNKKILDKIGGYNENIHIGEDSDVSSRAQVQGFPWIKDNKIIAYHPSSNKEFILRRWNHRSGILNHIINGSHNLLYLILRRIGGLVFFPLSTLIYTRNIKSALYAGSYKLIENIATLQALKGGLRKRT